MKQYLWIKKINKYTHDAYMINFSILGTNKIEKFPRSPADVSDNNAVRCVLRD